MATIGQDRLDVPGHVPPELVWSENFEEFATAKPDPFRRMGELHDGPDIVWVRAFAKGMGGGQSGWIVTRYALMREVLTDTENFMSGGEGNLLRPIGIDWPLIPLELNPPQQQRYRKVLEPFFAPASIDALDGAVRDACNELIAGFEQKDSCEFIGEFAEKFPSYIFLDLMGMPRERLQDFLAWERGMLRGETPELVVGSMRAVLNYLEHFLAEQCKNPKSDMMKGIVSARLDDGQKLSEREMLSIAYLLYIGGLDTVYSTIGWIFWHLAQDQPLQDRLRDHPEEIPRATEELLRAFSAASSGRRVKRDMEFHGVKMRAGDTVKTFLSLASRDPQAYDDPHRIDIDRMPRHIAFGTGPHTCLGLRLAKREIKIVLETFLSRFRNIRIPAGERHEFHVGSVFGIDRLPLAWDRVEEQGGSSEPG
jgi:cytochrome P450